MSKHKKTPFISILIPTYNAEKFIQKTINSVLSQTVDNKHFEVIIVDDGSTDNTKKIIKKLIKNKLNYIFVTQKNQGSSMARNALLSKISTKTEWVIWLDADDYLSHEYIECFYDWLNSSRNNGETVVKSNWIMSKKTEKLTMKTMKFKIDSRIMVRVMKKNLFDNYEFPKLKFAIDDWDHYVHRYQKIKLANYNNEKFNYYYVWNDDSLTRSNVVYRSRLIHAINIMKNPKTRKIVLEHKVIEHYYSHLWLVSKLWFPDLHEEVKAIKYHTKEPISLKFVKFIVQMKVFNNIIRKKIRVNND